MWKMAKETLIKDEQKTHKKTLPYPLFHLQTHLDASAANDF